MKTLRVLLVMLLVLVLPLRGVLAEVAHCFGPSAPTVQMDSGAHTHAVQAAPAGELNVSPQDTVSTNPIGHTDAPNGSIDGCTVGMTSCSMAPFMSEFMAAAAVDGAAVAFPPLTAPPPAHPSGVQDRPPRRI